MDSHYFAIDRTKSPAEKALLRRALGCLERMSLLHLLLLGLGLRLVWILLCPNEPTSDQWIYHTAARDLALGRGFIDDSGAPHGWWPVGYPAALAPFYWILNPHAYHSAYYANLLFGLLAIGGAYALALELFGRSAAVAAGLVVAAYPTFILYTTLAATENLFMPLALWSSWLFARAAQQPARLWAYCAAGGVVIGLSAYVRAPGLLLAAGFPVLSGCQGRSYKQLIGGSLLIAAVAMAVLVPWGSRTQEHFGTFQLVSMNGGSNLWMGNHEGATGGYVGLPEAVQGMSIPERDAWLRERALKFIRENPGEYVRLTVRRLWISLRSDTSGPVWNEIGIRERFGERAMGFFKLFTSAGYYAGLAALAAALWLRRRQLDRRDLFLATLVAATAFSFIFIVGGNRYNVPMAPYVLVWASSLVWAIDASSAMSKVRSGVRPVQTAPYFGGPLPHQGPAPSGAAEVCSDSGTQGAVADMGVSRQPRAGSFQ